MMLCPKCNQQMKPATIDGKPGHYCLLCQWAEPPTVRFSEFCTHHTPSVAENAPQPVQAISAPQKGNKYGARKTECAQGHLHASAKESRRCDELSLRQKAGEILALEIEPVYQFEANCVVIGRYRPDFEYWDKEKAVRVVEDVKSSATRTTAYRLRKRMMLAFHGIEVQEV